jgi:hypothetical protein
MARKAKASHKTGKSGEGRLVEAFPLVDGTPTPKFARLRPATVDLDVFSVLPTGAIHLQPHRPTGPSELRSIRHPASASTFLLLVSEGFPPADAAAFFVKAGKVAEQLLATEPFKSLEELIAIHAMFLPLDGAGVVNIGCDRSPEKIAKLKPTLFATQGCVDHSTTHLWCGDEDEVRSLIGAELAKGGRSISSYQFLAVLIDSADYGGAGSCNPTARPRVAWATTDHPQSVLILMHELGHAFGLQDEYENKEPDAPKPWRNISKFARPDRTPWKSLANAPRLDHVTCAHGSDWNGAPDVVGTFEGAGYHSTGLFRPTIRCRMRELAAPFCPVCADHIRASIDPTHPSRVGKES